MKLIVIILFLGIAALIFILIFFLKKNENKNESNHLYEKKEKLFSPAERSFLGVLEGVIDTETRIFGKVRVADVIKPKKGIQKWQTAFNKISSKHFDYILCKRRNLEIICAIELNDKSHDSKKRKARDIFLRNACKSAKIPLIEIKAEANYKIDEIKYKIRKITLENIKESIR